MTRLLIILTVVSCCFFVSINELAYIPTAFAALLFSIFLCNLPVIKFNKKTINFLIFLNASFLISFIISWPINVFFNNDIFFYAHLKPYGRIINIIIYTSIILFCDYLINNKPQILSAYNLVKYYYYSCFIFLASTIWQLLDFKLNFPIKFPLETRTYVHGSELQQVLENRITGLAQEPSYAASFLSEFIILTIFLVKNKYAKLLLIFIAILMSYYTHSPSVYISLGIVLLAYILMTFSIRKIVAIALPILAFVIYKIDFSRLTSFMYIFERIDNVESSSRFSQIINSLHLFITESNAFTFLFGHGVKSFSLIGTISAYSDFDHTSNNIFVDYLFETGVVGILIFIFFLYKCIVLINKCLIKEQKIIAILFFIEIITTSLIKADYASFRFLLIFYFIYIFASYKIIKK